MTTVSEEFLSLVRSRMRDVKIANAGDKVYKDECIFSFDTPFSKTGFYVNLKNFRGFGAEYVSLDQVRTGNSLYLLEKWTKVPKEQDASEKDPTKLAIGVDGGFQVDEQFTVEKEHELVVLPENVSCKYPCVELPEIVCQSVESILKHSGALVDAETAAWQEEPLRESRYAKDLPQLDNGKKISPDPSSWKCEESGLSENLWLNLSTGHIGSGRQNWDGSGGTGAALRHFQETGNQYPLAVKLGTITPQGADVYSYAPDEDDLVVDPYLAQHLGHWGIDIMNLEKTEKSMAELNVALNKTFEFDKITEAGSELAPVSGAGYLGLKNLGNSCYLNSVMQVLFTLPELKQRYADQAKSLFETARSDPENDLSVQLAKLGVALCTDRYCTSEPQPGEKLPSVEPRFFKNLVGVGHPEFSSGRQQDACEFLQHFLDLVRRSERVSAASAAGEGTAGGGPSSCADLFSFQVQDRIQCVESGMVTYKTRAENVLGLQIPMNALINQSEVQEYQERESKRQKLQEEGAAAYIQEGGGGETKGESKEEEKVQPIVPFQACLDRLGAEELVEDFYSSALGRKSVASKTVRLRTFPPYLVVHMRRYEVPQGSWTPRKLEVQVPAPDCLSLAALQGPAGLQPGEQQLPQEEDQLMTAAQENTTGDPTQEGGGSVGNTPPPVEADSGIVSQLMAMGFSENGSKRAALATGNSSAEASMEWVFAHMEDADFNDPLPPPSHPAQTPPAEGANTPGSYAGAVVAADPASVAMLASMGFTEAQAEGALKATQGSLERAADWLFSHADDLDAALAAVNQPPGATPSEPASAPEPQTTFLDGPPEYELLGFVSHMGANTGCGHYVCHIKKEGRWVLYNDEKVAESQNPPKDLGYLYVYKRKQ